ncbi:hypothetical protein JHK86_033709 [Glycine max]|nr:hypothetical protein JHK86_033709 [Glycine max]
MGVDSQVNQGLTVLVLCFLRCYPTLYHKFPHPHWPSFPCFSKKLSLHQTHQNNVIKKLTRLLMMSNSRALPLHSLHALKWDLGLPDTFHKNPSPLIPQPLPIRQVPQQRHFA